MSDDFGNLIGLMGLMSAFNSTNEEDKEDEPINYNVLLKNNAKPSVGMCDKCGTVFPLTERYVYMISTPNGDKKAYFAYCNKCNEIIEIKVEE
jgi:Fe2+ or Zn2+ uptake regulation protein